MSNSSLDINWTFGFSKDIVNSVHSLCTPDRNALFLLSSHSGVIYDFENRKQMILQGHCNIITCCAIDKTKRWIITADAGIEPLMVIWDSFTYLPVKTYISPHQYGIISLDISDDGLYIATLSAVPSNSNGNGYECDQELAIWAWTQPDDYPIQKKIINLSSLSSTSSTSISSNLFHNIKFNRSNSYQIVTTSNQNVFYWDWSNFSLDYYCGKLSKVDIGNFNGDMTSTVFLPDTDSALTSTSHGYIIVWEGKLIKNKKKNDSNDDNINDNNNTNKTIKTAIKVVKLLDCGIQLLDISPNNYLVLGCSDGAVRFYDFYLRLEAWFEDINAGPISSLSFSLETSPFSINEAGAPGLRFWTPNFIVSTRKGLIVGIESMIFEEIIKENRRGTLLMQGLGDSCVSIACHPSQPIVGFLTKNGILQIWNYELKLLMNLREFSILNLNPNTNSNTNSSNTNIHSSNSSIVRDFVFHPNGKIIAVGFTNGLIKLIHAETLVDLQTFSPSTDGILKLKFSLSGNYLAAYDELNHIILIKKDEDNNLDNTNKDKNNLLTSSVSSTNINPNTSSSNTNIPHYSYIGRAKVHKEKIMDIEFGIRDNNPLYETLISISNDKFLIEYDLLNSSISTGVLLLKVLLINNLTSSKFKIDSTSLPLCLFFLPRHNLDVEDRFVICCNDFKFKEFNLDNKTKRKTTLAPRYGLPPNKVIVINNSIQFLTPPPSSTTQNVSSSNSVSSTNSAPPLLTNPSNFINGTYVFSTGNRVIGLGQFPLDGNPLNSIGIVAHPGEITSISVSYDGKYLFSSGGSDLSINMWSLTYSLLNKPEKDMAADKDISPYLSLLEGGPGGELHETIIDYFYYCQLRNINQNSINNKSINAQPGNTSKPQVTNNNNNHSKIMMDDEDIMETRELTGLIPLEEIPALFRGIGYYPSEEEIINIINEVKYKEFMITGKTQDYIGLDEFIKLYINHRPVIALEKQQIDYAFSVISKYINNKNKSKVNTANSNNTNNNTMNSNLFYNDFSQISSAPQTAQSSSPNQNNNLNSVSWKDLKDLLLNYGENIDPNDLETYFSALVGNELGPFHSNELIDSDLFSEKVLGFEEN